VGIALFGQAWAWEKARNVGATGIATLRLVRVLEHLLEGEHGRHSRDGSASVQMHGILDPVKIAAWIDSLNHLQRTTLGEILLWEGGVYTCSPFELLGRFESAGLRGCPVLVGHKVGTGSAVPSSSVSGSRQEIINDHVENEMQLGISESVWSWLLVGGSSNQSLRGASGSMAATDGGDLAEELPTAMIRRDLLRIANNGNGEADLTEAGGGPLLVLPSKHITDVMLGRFLSVGIRGRDGPADSVPGEHLPIALVSLESFSSERAGDGWEVQSLGRGHPMLLHPSPATEGPCLPHFMAISSFKWSSMEWEFRIQGAGEIVVCKAVPNAYEVSGISGVDLAQPGKDSQAVFSIWVSGTPSDCGDPYTVRMDLASKEGDVTASLVGKADSRCENGRGVW